MWKIDKSRATPYFTNDYLCISLIQISKTTDPAIFITLYSVLILPNNFLNYAPAKHYNVILLSLNDDIRYSYVPINETIDIVIENVYKVLFASTLESFIMHAK